MFLSCHMTGSENSKLPYLHVFKVGGHHLCQQMNPDSAVSFKKRVCRAPSMYYFCDLGLLDQWTPPHCFPPFLVLSLRLLRQKASACSANVNRHLFYSYGLDKVWNV